MDSELFYCLDKAGGYTASDFISGASCRSFQFAGQLKNGRGSFGQHGGFLPDNSFSLADQKCGFLVPVYGRGAVVFSVSRRETVPQRFLGKKCLSLLCLAYRFVVLLWRQRTLFDHVESVGKNCLSQQGLAYRFVVLLLRQRCRSSGVFHPSKALSVAWNRQYCVSISIQTTYI